MKYDIVALKRKMLIKYPFFGSTVANVDYKEDMNLSTAGTDGKTIYYNPEYLEGLSSEERTFLFAHEICHIAFNHILRSEGKDHELWNIATDAVINQFLKRDGLKMVPFGVDMTEAIHYDAEQLYEKIAQEKQQGQPRKEQGNRHNQPGNQRQSSSNNTQQSQTSPSNDPQEQNQTPPQQSSNLQSQDQSQDSRNDQENDSKNQSSSGSNSSRKEEKGQDSSKKDVGHDTHSLWEEAVKKHKEEQGKEQSELEEKQEELEAMGEKAAFQKNHEDYKKQLEELKEAISKQASQAGTSTNRDIRMVQDIGKAKPLIDWRYVLREAIKYDVDWSYKNATFEDGIVVANLEEKSIPETEIVLDTSGSINEVLLKNFLRECKNILQYSRLKVGCFDTEFYGFHEIRTEEDIENMQFKGGGGTDFNVAIEAFSRRVENKIIFTDGDASMPKMPIHAVWIVFGGERIKPKGGKVINITSKQLDRLSFHEIDRKGRTK